MLILTCSKPNIGFSPPFTKQACSCPPCPPFQLMVIPSFQVFMSKPLQSHLLLTHPRPNLSANRLWILPSKFVQKVSTDSYDHCSHPGHSALISCLRDCSNFLTASVFATPFPTFSLYSPPQQPGNTWKENLSYFVISLLKTLHDMLTHSDLKPKMLKWPITSIRCVVSSLISSPATLPLTQSAPATPASLLFL